MEELREELPCYAKENTELFRAKVHGIKSASRQIRKDYLSEDAEIMEMAAIIGNQKYMDRHLEDLLSCMDDAIEEVRGELSYMQDALAKTESNHDGQKKMSKEERKSIWEKIARAFAEYDTGQIERGLESLETVTLGEEEQRIYEQAYALFMDFAYEEGAAYMEKILKKET